MKAKREKNQQNKELQAVMYFFLVLFLGMIAYLMYFLVFKSDTFINNPYNKLQDTFSSQVIRGEIHSEDGLVLAKSHLDENHVEIREYPYGRMTSHIVGYTANGKSGLEKEANFHLLFSHEFFIKQIADDLSGKKSMGDTVVLNLNMALQTCAYEALGDYDGAVIVMEPETGKILALVSKPDFDPNTVEQDWETINREDSTVLFNRATQGSYTPGSVFKIFTTLAYISQHADFEDYSFDCGGKITKEGKTIHCASNKKHGKETLMESFANSCNASYASLAEELDKEEFTKLCNRLLFNQNLPIDFVSAKSSFSLQEGDSTALCMETVIGQGKTTVSPLHMAMVMSAIANDGQLMTPYFIDHIENADGIMVRAYSPKEYTTLLDKESTEIIREYLKAVVTEGTGSKLKSGEYQAYGKTGTAQVSDVTAKTNAWFAGYAKGDGEKSLAIAVVVENSGSGSAYAVPIAKKVFDLYFGQ